ncbi:MAG: hypothetical protein OXR66_04325 [Candidatus Woesearchaeota archaeon]|nr:hypothetical protein [Candidatus Woesearchaeota archaeon]
MDLHPSMIASMGGRLFNTVAHALVTNPPDDPRERAFLEDTLDRQSLQGDMSVAGVERLAKSLKRLFVAENERHIGEIIVLRGTRYDQEARAGTLRAIDTTSRDYSIFLEMTAPLGKKNGEQGHYAIGYPTGLWGNQTMWKKHGGNVNIPLFRVEKQAQQLISGAEALTYLRERKIPEICITL